MSKTTEQKYKEQNYRTGKIITPDYSLKDMFTPGGQLKSAITDPDGRSAEVDQTTGYLINLSAGHHKRHEGELFRFIHKVSALAAGVHEMLFTTGAGPELVCAFSWVCVR